MVNKGVECAWGGFCTLCKNELDCALLETESPGFKEASDARLKSNPGARARALQALLASGISMESIIEKSPELLPDKEQP